MKQPFGYTGRRVVVTGGSRGVGAALLDLLAELDAAHVTVLDLTAPPGPHDSFVATDLADEDAVREAMATIDGAIHALFNNAGVADTQPPHSVLGVNYLAMRTLSEGLRDRMPEGSAIVNTASTASLAGEEFQATYNASKGAVAALTRSLAVDLAPRGIRVNAVAPGWVSTRSTRAVIGDPELWSKYRSRIPLDRAATTVEIAAVHAFLASDDAAYVTGAVVVADGGLLAGYRYSNWRAVPPPADGHSVGIPDLPADLREKQS